MDAQPQTELKMRLDRDGYVLVPNAFSALDIESLRAVSHSSISLARAGKWPHVRTLPKQFPPWNNDTSDGIWGVQHLLHPDMPGQELYAKTYFGDPIVRAVTDILDCDEEDLIMELYNMLIRPDHDFALRWHRDDISPEVCAEEEIARLQQPIVHAQWNLALYDDQSLVVVPGSHKRARTEVERKIDPYENKMPGQKVVKMNSGDIVFYNNNILHRGIYSSNTERITLHGSMGITKADPARARNVLQHGIGDWVSEFDFSSLPERIARRAQCMKQNLLSSGTNHRHGYSQID